MENAAGRRCSQCRSYINPGEKVICCSVCGRLYHLQCWKENQLSADCCKVSLPVDSQRPKDYIKIEAVSPAVEQQRKECPFCGEEIPFGVLKCKYCHSALGQGTLAANMDYGKPSAWSRFWAYIVDSLISSVGVVPVWIYLWINHGKTEEIKRNVDFWGLDLILTLVTIPLLIWGIWYYFTKDGRPFGQSIGKKAAGLMVVSLKDNRPCTKGKSALRQLVWFVNCIPYIGWVLTLAECILVLTDKKGRRMGDRLAGTQVINASAFRR